MKRKRKWLLWLIIALGCMIIVFVTAELTGASITSILGLGILGILGAIGVIAVLVVGTVFLILPITGGIWYLLAHIISNREILYITLGSLGFCAILTGWILTVRQSSWSLLVMMVGFGLGCFAGAEYQKYSLSVSHESERVIEQIPNKTRGND